ncbi:MAG: 1-acyl-sn-glycerol-3-phosphate acyltransferase [Pseudoflavonifractor sp.]|nr:1-acyl-sn-glycerol-3-phosphate acyltransferase [Pseudoflavonifractor sp.]
MIPVLVVATILTAVITIIGSVLGMGRSWGYYPAKWWSRLFCLMTFVSVSVRGRENIDSKTSYVFVANHQGAYDIFSIYGYLNHNFRWMMKKGLEKIPFVGYSCKVSGQIMVDSSSPAAVKATMSAAERQLSGGMSLVVFPEGSRSFNGRMGRFKKGAYTLAVEFGLPVVPITIDGAFDVMPRTAKLPRPGHITLTIHRPIMPGDGGHDLGTLMDESREAIASALPDRYR